MYLCYIHEDCAALCREDWSDSALFKLDHRDLAIFCTVFRYVCEQTCENRTANHACKRLALMLLSEQQRGENLRRRARSLRHEAAATVLRGLRRQGRRRSIDLIHASAQPPDSLGELDTTAPSEYGTFTRGLHGSLFEGCSILRSDTYRYMYTQNSSTIKQSKPSDDKRSKNLRARARFIYAAAVAAAAVSAAAAARCCFSSSRKPVATAMSSGVVTLMLV